tara:strand:+ start:634 stop:840 length:207 start_codon:yes stop_codon:yes gene_type:complete
MTRRKETLPIQKCTLNLYAGEFAKLQELYPRAGAAKVVRELVHAHLRNIEEQVAQQTTPIQIEDLPDD